MVLILLVAAPAFIHFTEPEGGPGAKHAAILISLAAGVIVGILAQRTRLCMVGGIRDLILFKDWTLLLGFVGILIAAAIANVCFGFFHVSFTLWVEKRTTFTFFTLGNFFTGTAGVAGISVGTGVLVAPASGVISGNAVAISCPFTIVALGNDRNGTRLTIAAAAHTVKTTRFF